MDGAQSENTADEGVTTYMLTLPFDVRARYVSKIAVLGCDPFTMDPKEFGHDRMAWPFNYLVCR